MRLWIGAILLNMAASLLKLNFVLWPGDEGGFEGDYILLTCYDDVKEIKIRREKGWVM